jgi:hypothetical protein
MDARGPSEVRVSGFQDSQCQRANTLLYARLSRMKIAVLVRANLPSRMLREKIPCCHNSSVLRLQHLGEKHGSVGGF